MKFADCKTKAARIAFIKEKLGTNKAWALKGLVEIYKRQTSDEQASQTTRLWNSVGFNGPDAFILSSFAEQQIGNKFVGSTKQMDILFKKMPKYAKQLESISSK